MRQGLAIKRGQGWRGHVRPVIFGRAIGKGAERHVGNYVALMHNHHAIGVGQFADNGKIKPPAVKNFRRLSFAARLQNHQHAFLAFRQQHFVAGHVGFAARHFVEVETNADIALIGHLDRRRGEPRRAHILNTDNRVRTHQFLARFQQQFFGERVAHLNGRSFFVRGIVKLSRGHGCAMNAIASGFRADIDDRRANAGGRGIKYFIGAREADTHGIDQNIAIIAGVEINLAAHRRHADAIAIAANAGNDTGHKVAGFFVVGLAEAQRVQVGNRTRAHGKHIAHNAAHTRGRALIGFDEGGVIMAFHFENCRVAVTDIDHTGIFAGSLNDLRAVDGKFLQPFTRRFIRTMLRPHDGKNAQFGKVRLAAHMRDNHIVFVWRQPMLGDQFGGYGRVVNMRCAHASISIAPSNRRRPSSPPNGVSARRSGWGIMPSTRPVASVMPAISRQAPFGLSPAA